MKTTVIVGIVCLLIGIFLGAVIYAMVAIKRLDEYKWQTEKNIQELITKYSERIFALQDIIDLVKLRVKEGYLVGTPAHQLNLLNQLVGNAAKEWEKENLKAEEAEKIQ